MLPIVIPENLISLFKYWQGGIKVGMTYQNELYLQLRTYNLERRLEVYDDGYKLSKKGNQVCITVNKTSYTLWQTIRSWTASSESLQAANSNTEIRKSPLNDFIPQEFSSGSHASTQQKKALV
ncbi:MAG: hypothetical protein AAGE59_20640 [Cyanobacteria bacterium P01_F01_bin.86]